MLLLLIPTKQFGVQSEIIFDGGGTWAYIVRILLAEEKLLCMSRRQRNYHSLSFCLFFKLFQIIEVQHDMLNNVSLYWVLWPLGLSITSWQLFLLKWFFFLRKDTRYVVKLQLISPLPSIVCAPLKKETVEVLIWKVEMTGIFHPSTTLHIRNVITKNEISKNNCQNSCEREWCRSKK